MSAECRCGTFVSASYVRVRGRPDYEGEGDVGACPTCSTLREPQGFREARSAGGYDVEVELG